MMGATRREPEGLLASSTFEVPGATPDRRSCSASTSRIYTMNRDPESGLLSSLAKDCWLYFLPAFWETSSAKADWLNPSASRRLLTSWLSFIGQGYNGCC